MVSITAFIWVQENFSRFMNTFLLPLFLAQTSQFLLYRYFWNEKGLVAKKKLSRIKFWMFYKIKLSWIKVGLYYIYFTDKHFQPYWNRVFNIFFFTAIRFWAPSWTAGAPFDEDAQGQHCFVQSHREWRHRSGYIRICTNKIRNLNNWMF